MISQFEYVLDRPDNGHSSLLKLMYHNQLVMKEQMEHTQSMMLMLMAQMQASQMAGQFAENTTECLTKLLGEQPTGSSTQKITTFVDQLWNDLRFGRKTMDNIFKSQSFNATVRGGLRLAQQKFCLQLTV